MSIIVLQFMKDELLCCDKIQTFYSKLSQKSNDFLLQHGCTLLIFYIALSHNIIINVM